MNRLLVVWSDNRIVYSHEKEQAMALHNVDEPLKLNIGEKKQIQRRAYDSIYMMF